jgi:mRNA interferase HicA
LGYELGCGGGLWPNRSVAHSADLLAHRSAAFQRWLEGRGCPFESGKGGHLRVRLGRRFSVLPMHGSPKEIGKGLAEKIHKDLGLQ